MDASSLGQILHDAGPLLILAFVILVGFAFGELAKRIRLPSITGQIVAGVVMGKAGLDLFEERALVDLQPLTHFALGLIAVTVGAHLNIKRLRNAGRRLFFLLITESTIVPLSVFLALWGLVRLSPSESILYATVAIATAPATVVAIVMETRSKGVFVKTLVAAVALNNMACILLFEVARAVTTGWEQGQTNLSMAWQQPVSELLIALAIGGGAAVAMSSISRLALPAERLATAAVAALALTSGLASTFDVSPLLACLFLGMIQTNITPNRSQLIDSIFADFQPAILTVFYVLAGLHISLEHAALAGISALVLFSARIGGKLIAAGLAMRLAQATDRVRDNLGIALIPQAGVAIGLVIILQDDPAFAGIAESFTAVVLTVVTANEIIGPLMTRFALGRTGETNRDRMRLIDFLQEEQIVTDFRARSKEHAIEELVDLLLRTNDLAGVSRSALLDSVQAREAEASTCLGGGLAVPHGILPEGRPLVGVMALSREGLDFETPDGRPVHCMVLLGTSPDERDRHLQVLAALSRTIGAEASFQEELFNAKSPAHAYETLHGEESEDFNYFLDGSSPPKQG